MSEQTGTMMIPFGVIAHKETFESTVIDAVDQTLSALGQPIKDAIYRSVEKQFGLTKQQIPCEMALFTHAIEYIFKDAAALVEGNIIKNINREVKGFSYGNKGEELPLVDYIVALQKHFNNG